MLPKSNDQRIKTLSQLALQFQNCSLLEENEYITNVRKVLIINILNIDMSTVIPFTMSHRR